MSWSVEFYKDNKGKEPVSDFIDSLPMGTQAKVLRLIDLLGNYGVLLKKPYTKQIREKIREIRIKDNRGAVRVLYFTFTGRRLFFCTALLRNQRKHRKKTLRLQQKGWPISCKDMEARDERKNIEGTY